MNDTCINKWFCAAAVLWQLQVQTGSIHGARNTSISTWATTTENTARNGTVQKRHGPSIRNPDV